MIYIFENDSNNASVVYDETTLTEQDKAKGIAVEYLPVPETATVKTAILKCKKATGEVWYEYIDKPVETTDQRIVNLEIAMAAIIGGAL